MKQIPQRLRQVMGQRTQREWGRQLNVPQQTISRYLSDGTTLRLSFLLQLARKEKVNLNWLLLGEGRMRRQG